MVGPNPQLGTCLSSNVFERPFDDVEHGYPDTGRVRVQVPFDPECHIRGGQGVAVRPGQAFPELKTVCEAIVGYVP